MKALNKFISIILIIEFANAEWVVTFALPLANELKKRPNTA